MQSPNNMVAKCQACGENKEANYIKYNLNGFDLIFLICVDCFTHVQMAGLRQLRVVITQFRTATRIEAEKLAVEMAKPPTKKKVSKKVSKKVPRGLVGKKS